MHEIKKIDWQEMKDAVTNNSLVWQYTETRTVYFVFATNGNIIINYKMHKQTPKEDEQIDFEDNIKSAAKKW